MIKFLIASHGYLADGFKSAIGIIMGDEIANRITTLNAFVNENENIKDKIAESINSLASHDKLIIFSDIMYGSVNQYIMPYIEVDRVILITGVNFPLICEVISTYSFSENVEIDQVDLRNIVDKAKDEIIFVNEHVDAYKNETDEDFFTG